MKSSKIKFTVRYIYDKVTGSFMGFLVGMGATGLVSHFFETRSIRNLWGLTAKKTIISKKTFGNLEWIASIIIGFLVFEVFTKVLKKKLDKELPRMKLRAIRWMVRKDLHTKLKTLNLRFDQKRILFLLTVQVGVKQAFNRFSKR